MPLIPLRPTPGVYLDYPLGQAAGRAGAPDEQDHVLAAAFIALETMTEPGSIEDLDLEWAADPGWKDHVMRVDPKTLAAPMTTARQD